MLATMITTYQVCVFCSLPAVVPQPTQSPECSALLSRYCFTSTATCGMDNNILWSLSSGIYCTTLLAPPHQNEMQPVASSVSTARVCFHGLKLCLYVGLGSDGRCCFSTYKVTCSCWLEARRLYTFEQEALSPVYVCSCYNRYLDITDITNCMAIKQP